MARPRPQRGQSSSTCPTLPPPASLHSHLIEAWECLGKVLSLPSHWLNLASPPEDADLDSSAQASPSQTWCSVSGVGGNSRDSNPSSAGLIL